MELIKQIEGWLRGEGFAALCGRMAPGPDRAVAVYATALRETDEDDGVDVLLHVRGERHSDSALVDAMRIYRALRGFEGRFTDGGERVTRVEVVQPPSGAGLDAAQRPFYTMGLRVFIG